MILRDYQQAAVDSVYRYLCEQKGNPCVVIPTGGGKTPVMSTICHDAVTKWNGRVLVLAHVKELLEQTAATLRRLDPDLPVGVYSAGLNSRDTSSSIIVAGIQSVYQRACELGRFDLILIDEAHLLPPDREGMYRQFLKDAKIVNPNVRLIGLTATPYRMKTGMLCGPDNFNADTTVNNNSTSKCPRNIASPHRNQNLLNDVCYEIGVKQLISQGFLCPLKTKAGRHKADTSELHVRAGEFVQSEIEDLMDNEQLVGSACREIVQLTRDRNSVLVFAASVDHALHVQETITKLSGEECGIVTGDTPAGERADTLARFKGEKRPRMLFDDGKQLKYLVNVNVLTTGFDAPNIDCVVLLRPTASPGLFYQQCGRGFRLHESKTDCLVLDYGGNILRHGPVDAITIEERKTSGSGGAPAKECPECQSVIHAGYSACPDCGYEFPPPETNTHDAQASNEGIISGEVSDTQYEVLDVFYNVHTKRGADESAPKTLRVDYRIGLDEWQAEWVCLEHKSSAFALRKAVAWWKARSHMPPPTSAQEAVDMAGAGILAETKKITVRKVAGERFDRIIEYDLGEKPDLPEPGAYEPTEPTNVDAFGDYVGAEESDEIPF